MTPLCGRLNRIMVQFIFSTRTRNPGLKPEKSRSNLSISSFCARVYCQPYEKTLILVLSSPIAACFPVITLIRLLWCDCHHPPLTAHLDSLYVAWDCLSLVLLPEITRVSGVTVTWPLAWIRYLSACHLLGKHDISPFLGFIPMDDLMVGFELILF